MVKIMKKLLLGSLSLVAAIVIFAAPSPKTGTALVTYNYTFGDTNNPANILVTNFVAYFGTVSGQYTGSVNAGTNFSCMVPNLARGATYFFVVTAQASNGLESDYSLEVSVTIPNKPSKPTSPSATLQ